MASDFKSAFRAARASGKSVFTWNGKSYNTKLKEADGPATPKARPPAAVDGPKARPVAKRAKAEATAERKVDKATNKAARYESRAKRNAAKATNKAARYESRAKRNAAPAISSDTKDKRQNVADKFMAKNRLYKKGGKDNLTTERRWSGAGCAVQVHLGQTWDDCFVVAVETITYRIHGPKLDGDLDTIREAGDITCTGAGTGHSYPRPSINAILKRGQGRATVIRYGRNCNSNRSVGVFIRDRPLTRRESSGGCGGTTTRSYFKAPASVDHPFHIRPLEQIRILGHQ